jgi:hypothetical protein
VKIQGVEILIFLVLYVVLALQSLLVLLLVPGDRDKFFLLGAPE